MELDAVNLEAGASRWWVGGGESAKSGWYFGAQSPFGDTIVPGTRYQALTVGNYNTIISMLLHPRPYAHAVI